MGKNEKTPLNVDGQEYMIEDFTDRQTRLFDHVKDLDRKINNSQFNLEQLQFARTKFVQELAQDLKDEEITDEDYEEPTADE